MSSSQARNEFPSVPNPGSPAAIEIGCTCPRIDNEHGRGYMGIPTVFVYSEDCPIHGSHFNRILHSLSPEETESSRD